jgi:CHAT domain-containing protein
MPIRSIGVGQERGVDFADESIAVGQIIPLDDVATNEAATKAALAAFLAQENIVHVSAHGEWFGSDASLSGIALEDGRFGISDVLATSCRSPLVILSACDSGRVHVEVNDDTVGLVPALIAKGVGNVIASLWPVSASAATTFVLSLLTRLRSGASILESLQAARGDTRVASSDVADWGAFELFGVS